MLIGAVFVVLFCVILGRLFYLQIIKSDYYQQNFTQKETATEYSLRTMKCPILW